MLQQRGAAAFQWVWGVAAPAGCRGLRAIQGASRKTLARLRATPWQALARRHWKLLPVVGAVLVVGIIWKVPQWQAAGWQGQMEPKDLAKLQNDARTTLIQVLGGAVLLIGLYFTLRNLQLTQDRQITEHYTRAVEQLRSDKLEVRLGAIYALERIARDSERDHWPIMEILTAYVREHAPWPPRPTSPEQDAPSDREQTPAIEIQSILTVPGRRTRTYGKGEDHRLDLMYTDLRGADLGGTHLEGVQLSAAHLEGAYLGGAHLEGAQLAEAHLESADLEGIHLEEAYLPAAYLKDAWLLGAYLRGTDLRGAHLERAGLEDAHLEGADLSHTHLKDAYLEGAHLEGVRNLTVEQLTSVATLYRAHLDPPFLKQIQQHHPHLLEKPQD